MGSADSTTLTSTPTFGTAAVPEPRNDALHDAILDLIATTDAGEIAGKALVAARRILAADGASIWVPDGERLLCRGAIGEGREALSGTEIGGSEVGAPLAHERDVGVLSADLLVGEHRTAVLRLTRSFGAQPPFGVVDQTSLRQLMEVAGASMSAATRLASSRREAGESARDLALITEMSREITSTLDLDRVLRMVVNLASKALEFDLGAIALYEHGVCDIRAVAGRDGIDAKDSALQDLAVRAAWAAGLGETFYLSERTDPGSDAERTFVQIFGVDLERDGAMSGLYLPLKDEEGIVGILLFEADRPELATTRQRELAEILTNQATVAVRNARLYHQVPLADAIGAFSARKQAFFEMPARRRATFASIALIVVALLTLVQWPLRVEGTDSTFRPLARAEIRPLVDGVVDRVFVREGMVVDRGAPIAHLRDDERRARRDAALAAVAAADRGGAIAAARGDAAEERLERLRASVLRQEASLLEDQIASSTIRSPAHGIVLTERPEERNGSRVGAGDLLVVVGRTDSLELDLGVDQREITRVRPGDEVRLRVAALPQRTFSGRVESIAELATSADSRVSFPVRAVVANPDGLLRSGMVAYARVLTERASLLGRVTRQPVRALRLWWWRIWS